eukprot:3674698-Pyramimonas_sp.AAC.1
MGCSTSSGSVRKGNQRCLGVGLRVHQGTPAWGLQKGEATLGGYVLRGYVATSSIFGPRKVWLQVDVRGYWVTCRPTSHPGVARAPCPRCQQGWSPLGGRATTRPPPSPSRRRLMLAPPPQ